MVIYPCKMRKKEKICNCEIVKAKCPAYGDKAWQINLYLWLITYN